MLKHLFPNIRNTENRKGPILEMIYTFQSTGVATFLTAVSWSESTTRRISLKQKQPD